MRTTIAIAIAMGMGITMKTQTIIATIMAQ